MFQSKVLLRSRKKKAFSFIQEGRFAVAKTLYQEICRSDSRDAEAWFLLGAVNGQLGMFEEAIACCRTAIELSPDYMDAHYNLAQAYMHQSRLEEAAVSYKEVVRLKPDHADALNNLGLALERQGHYDDSIRYYREALRVQPNYTDAYINLGNALQAFGKLEDSVQCFQLALKQKPGSCKIYILLGFALLELGMYQEAINAFDSAQQIEPNNRDAVIGKAAVHERRGEFEASYALLRPLLENGAEDERLAVIFARVSRHANRRTEAISLLERILARGQTTGIDLIPLHFQLGKLYDELKEYAQAFPHFQTANALKPISRENSSAVFLAQMDAIMEQFSADFLAHTPRASNSSERPIFIIGMPRSGTTLTEQILASHPAVHGGGELKDISELVVALPALLGASQAYPWCLESATPAGLDKAAHRYLNRLTLLSPGASRVTDKMPHNFQHLGLIALLFPQAHIIHCQRDPLDTCLSIFTFDFNAVHSYATNLRDLGEHYLKYEQMMAHWKTVLPLSILEVQYEEMVANQEAVSRKMIEFCGLEWDEQCLRFYESKRVVNTFSYDQVRRPIYKKSVSRWKHYDQFLGSLKEVLNR